MKTMTYKKCTIEGCSSKRLARGWCQKHYQRWKAHGDPHKVINHYRNDFVRFMSKVEIDKRSGCWNWTGAVNGDGYASFGLRAGNKKYVNKSGHCYSYEVFVGPRVVGMHIDHLCFNKKCVNAEHLEMVTVSENNYRRCERMRDLRRQR